MKKCIGCGYEGYDENCPQCGCKMEEKLPVDDKTSLESKVASQYNTPTKKVGFYEKSWFIILMLILLPPIGLILMWVFKNPPNKVARIVLTALFSIWLIVCLVYASPDNNDYETTDDMEVTEEVTEEVSANLVSITAEYEGSTEAGTLIDSSNSDIVITATYDDDSTELIYDFEVENPSKLKAGATSTYNIVYDDKKCQLKIKCTTLTKAQYISSCKNIAYSELARNPDNYEGQKVKFTGEVVQVQEDDGIAAYRINVTQGSYGIWDDTIYVLSTTQSGSSRILEDDIVTFYGESTGLFTYETVMGSELTIPSVNAIYIER